MKGTKMLNNTLTIENADEVAKNLVDALVDGDQHVHGFTFVDAQTGGDEWVVALVHDVVRDKWITVNEDTQQTSVMEFDNRPDAERDITETVDNYSETAG